jgi:predicted phosphoribosyltransferase
LKSPNGFGRRLTFLWCASWDCPAKKSWLWGAIAAGGFQVLNSEVVEVLGIPTEVIDAVAAREQEELKRRELA